MMQKADVLIIGGGLTGLTLNYLLRKAGYAALILEARDRLGGRIWTKTTTEGVNIDMGATWLGHKHTHLVELLQKLNLPVFQQHLGAKALFEQHQQGTAQFIPLPPNNEPSYRIQGGTSALIQALARYLPDGTAILDTPVEKIHAKADGVYTFSGALTIKSKVVVSTLPPNLLSPLIELQPTLPDALIRLMQQTHTWMGESIKAGVAYAQPFWREHGQTGTAFSHTGPFTELYDHADAEEGHFALKGFLRNDMANLSTPDRKRLVEGQLLKFFGQRALEYASYEETVWAKEPFTYAPYKDQVLPHQNNGQEMYRKPYWNGRLFLAGSETANAFPGYMEGAVRSAEWVYQALSKSPVLSLRK
ncbi:NAD(P)/FAD-dependent oxidoreductase [Phaeodactylibacter sp.]|uniref:flavin monoamine oxidase family protein n=1 Tax=Phaeodactylibacter sp. TaxID=1940289 RepID=UPI0025EDF990|nr:NAD(P)/FAD-dependent oxidoreductase [Phaeodactylibacter sp.]MCI4651684.1 FAD-dependent oxidoreductase [Phaeodactylibacter sp.]MCI5092641.1 FAD-dependent oxidoreductase [Phaeodactylibacter sp.]